MIQEDRENYYTIYINPVWPNPVEIYYGINSELDVQYVLYRRALVVLTVMSGRVLLMRNQDKSYTRPIPMHVSVSEQQLTMLKLRAIPSGLLDYLTNQYLCNYNYH